MNRMRFTNVSHNEAMSPEHTRLTYALLLSLLIHTWLMSLTFGPGFRIPLACLGRIDGSRNPICALSSLQRRSWSRNRRSRRPWSRCRRRRPLSRCPGNRSRRRLPNSTVATIRIRFAASAAARSGDRAGGQSESGGRSEEDAATRAVPAQTPLRSDQPGGTPLPPIVALAVIALAQSDESMRVVPANPVTPPPVIGAEANIPSRESGKPSSQDAGDAARARIAEEASQRAAEQLEEARKDAARREAVQARERAAGSRAPRRGRRRKCKRQRDNWWHGKRLREHEAARSERRAKPPRPRRRPHGRSRRRSRQCRSRDRRPTRSEAARIEAARIEAARIEAARIEAARIEAAQAEAAREARLQAIGRQLNEEAAKRDAAAGGSNVLPLTLSSARRYKLFGRADPNTEVIQYAEIWARKIEMNMTLDMVREAAKLPHADPLVTVAVRSDGSVESVTIVQSSGVPALDAAIHRVVRSQTPYQAFPPALAREYDVIEIRRTWYFDVAIRLY